MGLIIISMIIGCILGLFVEKTFESAFYGSVLGFAAGLFLYFLIGGIIGLLLPTKEIIKEQEICALNDSTSIEGTAFLFSSSIDEELVYRYVINTEKGKHIEEVDSNNAYIKESNSYKPSVKIHTFELEKDWYYLFTHNFFINKDYVEFFVPENSITHEYNIDLQ